MKGCKFWLLVVFLCVLLVVQVVEFEFCVLVCFVDVGWIDIIVIIVVICQVFEFFGYKIKVNLFLVLVIYCFLVNNDFDVFLGNWMFIMINDIKQYVEKGMVEILCVNLEGVKYILVVFQYVYDGGLCSFVDIVKFFDKLGNKIYGIELGNDGNCVVQSMIDKNVFELGKFKLVEFSEVGMFLQVQWVIWCNQWVVFFGWELYFMNICFQMKYLEGGDDFFGFNYGGVIIYINVCKGYVQECVNVG